MPRRRRSLRDSGFVTGTAAATSRCSRCPRARSRRSTAGAPTSRRSRRRELGRLLAPAGTPRAARRSRCRRAHDAHAAVHDRRATASASTLVVENRRGDFTPLALGEHGARHARADGAVPPEARGGRLVALRLSFPVIAAFVAGHQESGDVALGLRRVDGNAAARPRVRATGSARDGITRATAGAFHYVVNRAADSILRPREPLEGEPVPGRRHAGDRAGRRAERDRAAARREQRHPGAGRRDDALLPVGRRRRSSSPTCRPGSPPRTPPSPASRPPSELWLDAQPRRRGRCRSTSPRSARGCASCERPARARRDLAAARHRRSSALVLAAVGLLLTVVGDLRDERGSLRDLEAQGATPADLRRHVLLRASVVGVARPRRRHRGRRDRQRARRRRRHRHRGRGDALPPLRSPSTGRSSPSRSRRSCSSSAAPLATATRAEAPVNARRGRDLFRLYASPEGTSVALQGLTLDVEEGELLVVFGPSGSGKSTLLRILAGARPAVGRLGQRLRPRPPHAARPRARRVPVAHARLRRPALRARARARADRAPARRAAARAARRRRAPSARRAADAPARARRPARPPRRAARRALGRPAAARRDLRRARAPAAPLHRRRADR